MPVQARAVFGLWREAGALGREVSDIVEFAPFHIGKLPDQRAGHLRSEDLSHDDVVWME